MPSRSLPTAYRLPRRIFPVVNYFKSSHGTHSALTTIGLCGTRKPIADAKESTLQPWYMGLGFSIPDPFSQSRDSGLGDF